MRSLNGKTFIVRVDLTDKVETLVKRAAEKTNSDLNSMRLMFTSKELTDPKMQEMKINEVGLQNDSNTFIIYRLKGGFTGY